ncbi:MAG: alginate lyase family protein [Crocinitomicaceae bacterium]
MKLKQVSYQVFYRARKKLGIQQNFQTFKENCVPFEFPFGISNPISFEATSTFTFLNKSCVFPDLIDWNYPEYGKLWTYNLNYFDFLNQSNLDADVGMELIESYIKFDGQLKDGKEPYPISLRGINWIKFISKNKLSISAIDQILFEHYQILLANREYHLLGNHLLENGFSLYFSAYYFRNEKFLKSAIEILRAELNEQILKDGAHFELSAMYHQIMLHRLLDCIQLAKYNHWAKDAILPFLEEKATVMLSWLETITYVNGDIPMMNDSTFQIAPTTHQLLNYAKELEIKWGAIQLKESGYRKWNDEKYELVMDIGAIGPNYIPGHAHADTFNFELYVDNSPFIVDTGISTYEKNERRQVERSTSSHNTVVLNQLNSTSVWGGFRVGKRAEVQVLNENSIQIKASHNGYKEIKAKHQRCFKRTENQIIIEDLVDSKKDFSAMAYLHFHPSIGNIVQNDNELDCRDQKIKINFDKNIRSVRKLEYDYCAGFNKTLAAIAFEITFDKELKTTITL